MTSVQIKTFQRLELCDLEQDVNKWLNDNRVRIRVLNISSFVMQDVGGVPVKYTSIVTWELNVWKS
ncbi:MAG: hypothetical protein WC307_06285 [Candidatus Nanoarchaeia archaeon]|jgi:hypothetical protein